MAQTTFDFNTFKTKKVTAYMKEYCKPMMVRKAQAGIVLVDYKMAGKKIPCVFIPIKKKPEAMHIFKQIKATKEHQLKKTALAEVATSSAQDGKESIEIHIKKGGLTAEQLKAKGTKLFESGLKMKLAVKGGPEAVGAIIQQPKPKSKGITAIAKGVVNAVKKAGITANVKQAATENKAGITVNIKTNSASDKKGGISANKKVADDSSNQGISANKKVADDSSNQGISANKKVADDSSNQGISANKKEGSIKTHDKSEEPTDASSKKIFAKYIKRIHLNTKKIKADKSTYDDQSLIRKMDNLANFLVRIEKRIKRADLYQDYKQQIEQLKKGIQQIDKSYKVTFDGDSDNNSNKTSEDSDNKASKAEKAVAFILEKLDKLDENIDKLDANSSKFDDKPFMERIDKLAAFYRKVYDKMKSLDIDDMQVEDTFVELRQKIQKLAGGYQPDLGPAIKATLVKSAQEDDVYFSEEDNNFDFEASDASDDDAEYDDEDAEEGQKDSKDAKEATKSAKTNSIKTAPKTVKKSNSRPRRDYHLERIERLSESADKLLADKSNYDDKPLIEKMEALGNNYKNIIKGLNKEGMMDNVIRKMLFEVRDKIQDIDKGYQVTFGSKSSNV